MPTVNYKCGIDVTFSGVEGTDYAEEYYYHNLPVCDAKTVWIRSGTMIDMRHNVNNVAAKVGRQREVIGTGIGYTGVSGGGVIRYAFDKMWSKLMWGGLDGPYYQAYSGAFNMSGSVYEAGVPVVGTLSGNIANSGSASFYWRGMVDSIGDEWHVLKYADDDSTLGSARDEAWASDGKWFMTVVNPKTPCLTITTGTTGQFYTTPAYAYFMPVIRDQTTYFQGNCDFTIRDIYGNNVFYSINSGSYVNVGASSVTLNQANFNTGNNTLQYYYQTGFIRQRNIVKGPAFPSNGESHGNILWGDQAGFITVSGRIQRSPYLSTYNTFINSGANGQQNWANVGGRGYRLGYGGHTSAAWTMGSAANNAFVARLSGWNAKLNGATKTFAQFAKEMTEEQAWTTPNLGFELFMTSIPQATCELNNFGYWDVDAVLDSAVSYDMLMSGYRSDQHPSGITPIEDYFIRDTLANYVHFCNLWMGQHQQVDGMWPTCRNVGATLISMVMPTYSTPYYGTCGMDGNTKVYIPWCAFGTTGYTWKQMYVDSGYALGTYPNAPVFSYGMEGFSYSLIQPSGNWLAKADYYSADQCGHSIGLYRNLEAQYAPTVPHTGLDLFLDHVTAGTAIGLGNDGGPSAFTGTSALVLNPRWTTPAINAQARCQALPSNDENSDDAQIAAQSLWAFIYYDDTWFGIPSGVSLYLKRLGAHPKLKGFAR